MEELSEIAGKIRAQSRQFLRAATAGEVLEGVPSHNVGAVEATNQQA